MELPEFFATVIEDGVSLDTCWEQGRAVVWKTAESVITVQQAHLAEQWDCFVDHSRLKGMCFH